MPCYVVAYAQYPGHNIYPRSSSNMTSILFRAGVMEHETYTSNRKKDSLISTFVLGPWGYQVF